MKKKMIVRIIICFFAMMSFMCLTAEAKAKRQQVKGNAMSKYLDRQIQTCNAKKLLEVVECKYATESHLMSVVEKVKAYYEDDAFFSITKKEAIKIAKAIIKNKKCTSKVLEELANSMSLEFWFMVAKSKKCNEKTLKSLAEKVKAYYEDDAFFSITKKEAIKIAKAIIKNKKCTSKVLEELANSMSLEFWFMVAKSKKCNEKTLKSLAEKVKAYYEDDAFFSITKKEAIKIAKAIIKNKKCTSKVLEELANSMSLEFWFMVAKSKKCNEKTLKSLAEKVKAYYEDDAFFSITKKEAIKIAKAIIKNKKCTSKVFEELVASFGHKALEKRVEKAKGKRKS